jgi:hypothetical protein
LKEILKKYIINNKEKDVENGENEENVEIKPVTKGKEKRDENKNAKILNVGCGNSRKIVLKILLLLGMSEEMYDDGYQ